MFLIRIGERCILDAEKVSFIGVVKGVLHLGIVGEEDTYPVESKYRSMVLNHLGGLDKGILNLQSIFGE